MALRPLTPLPAQQTEFELVQTRIQEANARHKEYMDVLLAVQARTIATGDVIAADIPVAPPALAYP